MTQNYEVTDTVEQNRKTRIVVLKTEDHQLGPVIETVRNVINGRWPVKDFKTVTQGKGRPRLESEKDGEIYFRQRDTGEIEVRMSMASDNVREHVVEMLMENQSSVGGASNNNYTGTNTGTEEPEPLEDRTIGTSNVEPERVNDTVDEVVRPQGNDEVTLIPPFEKDEVGYVEGENTHGSWKKCEDCVHYVSGGGCKMVKGDIESDAHCDDLFADLQINGRTEEDGFKTNLIAKGDNFKNRMRVTSIQNIIKSVTDAIKSRLG